MAEQQLRLLILGAHPDDAEFHAGGLISRYRQLGHAVKIVSVTNGCSGHYRGTPEDLVRTRRSEAEAVARLMGVEYAVWDYPDGHLLPTLDVRQQVIAEIREAQPDLVLTHRPCDYHPDHRAVGQTVQDASYLVTVPLIVPDVPALRRDPVVAYMSDFFTRPNPLRPDVVLDIDGEFERVVDMLACHQSQVFDWLPYNKGILDTVPENDIERRAWLAQWFGQRAAAVAERFRGALCSTYGEDRGEAVQYAEVYEVSEYAGSWDEQVRQRLFPVG